MLHLRRRRTAGFSMMELLVVILLIAFMMAFLAMVFVNNIANAKIKAAKTLIHKLDVALNMYYQDFREYPPDTGYGLEPSKGTQGMNTYFDTGSLYRYLGQKVQWKKPSQNGGFTDMGSRGPYCEFTEKELKVYTDPKWGESFMVIDPWFHPIGYIGDPRRKIHNRDGVDLFSAGPDGVTASDDKSGVNHNFPPGYDGDNMAYDGNDNDGDGIVDNATELGRAVLNGCLTKNKKNSLKNIGNSDKTQNEVLDDINNWDPE